jgi:hypothetical protein
MVSRLEGCTTEEQRSVVRFCGQKVNAKDIYKEMNPVYGGKILSCKAVHGWVANVSLMTKGLKRRCGSCRGNSQKTSMLRVSTH